MAEQYKTYMKNKKRHGPWVLRVRYLCENVRKTGFEEAVEMATPAQKAILMDLAQVGQVGKSTFTTRGGTAFQGMLKRWEGFMEKLATVEACVSVPPRACTEFRN